MVKSNKSNVVFSADNSELTDIFDTDCEEVKTCEHIGYYVERVAYLENLVKQYKFDMLTGLMMKRDFQDAFNRLFEEYQFADSEFAMCLLDINGLHNINRIKGYAAGDALIKDVAVQLRREFAIHQVFRISGDEFAVLLRKSVSDLKSFKDKIAHVNNIEYVIESCNGYTSPKHMFKMMDKKLSVIKSKKTQERM